MRIFFINNIGGGFADHIEVEVGTTRPATISAADGACQAGPGDQVLQEADRVSITPVKIEGASQ